MNLTNRLRNTKVTVGILIASLIPLVLAFSVSAWVVFEKTSAAREMGRLQKLINPISLLSNLVHEQQKERGQTAVFLGSKGKQFGAALKSQRKVTDAKIASLNEYLTTSGISDMNVELARRLDAILKQMGKTREVRVRVDAMSIKGADAIAHYTSLNGQILDLIHHVSLLSNDGDITSTTLAFASFLKGKELAGIERAIGARGFAKSRFSSEEKTRFITLIESQNILYSQFLASATEAQQEQFALLLKSAPAQEVQEMRDVVFKTAAYVNAWTYSSSDFFSAQTKKINLLQKLEVRLSNDLANLMQAHYDAAIFDRNMVAGLTALLFLVALGLSQLFTHSVKQAFRRVLKAANELAAGDLDVEIPAKTDNEFGQIAGALEQFRDSIVAGQKTAQNMREAEIQEQKRKRAAEIEEYDAKAVRAAERETEKEVVHQRERAIAAEISAVVAKCAEGDFSERLSTSDKEGVLAEICLGVNKIGEVANHGLDQIKIALQALSDGNLNHKMQGEFDGVFNEIRNVMNDTSQSLAQSVGQIGQSSSLIGASTRELADAAGHLATRTEHSAATLEQTAAAIEVLSGLVTTTAGLTVQADKEAADIRRRAEESNEVVRLTIAAMGEIQSSTAAIGKTITLIDDITFQTNLLALNAGVEAARAGDAGRGFAVVASEVRDLAARSSESAREISSLIGISEQQVNKGVSMVDQTGAALQSILDRVSGIAEQIADISMSASEQSNSISEINLAARQLDKTTQQNAAMFEETTATSLALQQETDNLARVISAFDFEGGGDIKKRADGSVPTFQRSQNHAVVQQRASGNLAAEPLFADEDEWKDF